MPFEMSYFVARLQSRVSSQPEQVDIAIIGGGPVGLFAAYYAGLRNLHTCLIDSLDVLGGQLVVLYPEKYVYDVAGFPKILAKDLAHQLIQQAMQYHPSVRLGQRALELSFDETARTFTLTTDGEPLLARAVVISAGIGSFSPKTLPLPEANAFLNHGLCYSVKETQSLRDKKVLIVVSDGGDNASKISLEQVMKLAGESSAVIYTIGLFDEQDQDRNPAVLKRLAQATGGEAFLPEQGEVAAICERIARDIRHQYTFGYVPSNPIRDGTYRAIRVLARAKGHDRLSVRTRTGYIAGGEGVK